MFLKHCYEISNLLPVSVLNHCHSVSASYLKLYHLKFQQPQKVFRCSIQHSYFPHRTLPHFPSSWTYTWNSPGSPLAQSSTMNKVWWLLTQCAHKQHFVSTHSALLGAPGADLCFQSKQGISVVRNQSFRAPKSTFPPVQTLLLQAAPRQQLNTVEEKGQLDKWPLDVTTALAMDTKAALHLNKTRQQGLPGSQINLQHLVFTTQKFIMKVKHTTQKVAKAIL